MNPFISSAMSLIVPILSFYKDGFVIELPTNFDKPLKQKEEIKKEGKINLVTRCASSKKF